MSMFLHVYVPRLPKRDRSQSAFACLDSPNWGGVRAVKAAAAKRGRDSASLYGLTLIRFTVASSKRPQASTGRIELALRAPSDGICDPVVNVGLMPAATVDADPDLRRERALGNLAIDGGAGQPGSGEDGFQTDDPVWFAHGRAASCWLFLMASETRQDKQLQAERGALDSS